jgi:hypothetical protein
MTEQRYDAIIVGAGETGSPLAKRLCEAVSELLPKVLESLGSSDA